MKQCRVCRQVNLKVRTETSVPVLSDVDKHLLFEPHGCLLKCFQVFMARDVTLATLKSSLYVLLSDMSNKAVHIRKGEKIASTIDVPDHYDRRLGISK